MVEYSHRSQMIESELQDPFAAAWGARKCAFSPVLARSFTWVSARAGAQLVGFVNVTCDGGVHFFLLDTMAPGLPAIPRHARSRTGQQVSGSPDSVGDSS